MQNQAPKSNSITGRKKTKNQWHKILNLFLFLYLIANIWFISYTIGYLKNQNPQSISSYEGIKFLMSIGFVAVFFLSTVISKLIDLIATRSAGHQQEGKSADNQIFTNFNGHTVLNPATFFNFSVLKTKSFILFVGLFSLNFLLMSNTLKIARFIIENFY